MVRFGGSSNLFRFLFGFFDVLKRVSRYVHLSYGLFPDFYTGQRKLLPDYLKNLKCSVSATGYLFCFYSLLLLV